MLKKITITLFAYLTTAATLGAIEIDFSRFLKYEDEYTTIKKFNSIGESYVDGVTGGAVTKAKETARKAGEATRRGLDNFGNRRSGQARRRMERNTGVKDTSRGKVYRRHGRWV